MCPPLTCATCYVLPCVCVCVYIYIAILIILVLEVSPEHGFLPALETVSSGQGASEHVACMCESLAQHNNRPETILAKASCTELIRHSYRTLVPNQAAKPEPGL